MIEPVVLWLTVPPVAALLLYLDWATEYKAYG